MNQPLDDRLRDALHAEARRARPDPNAWSHVSERVDRGPARRSPAALLAVAAVFMVLSSVAVLFSTRDRSDDQPVAVEPSPTTPDATPPTNTDAEDADTGFEQTEVVVDPIDMGPTPPVRSEPPPTFVAVLPDGRLVTVDTATGDTLEELDWGGDLRDDSIEGGPYGIWQVALSADGEEIWYSRCCEPAAGITLRHPQDRNRTDMQDTLQADAPTFTMTSDWIVGASYIVPMRNTRTLDHRVWMPSGIVGFTNAVLSPDGQHLVAELWPSRDTNSGEAVGLRPMLVARTDSIRRSGEYNSEIIDDDPVELPSDQWTLPTFRRDGLLLVAEEGDGTWRQMLVDIDTLDVADPGVTYDGVPAMQRFDGSGEWLMVLLVDDPDQFPAAGRLVWFGPEGQSGTIPGTYTSAAW